MDRVRPKGPSTTGRRWRGREPRRSGPKLLKPIKQKSSGSHVGPGGATQGACDEPASSAATHCALPGPDYAGYPCRSVRHSGRSSQRLRRPHKARVASRPRSPAGSRGASGSGGKGGQGGSDHARSFCGQSSPRPDPRADLPQRPPCPRPDGGARPRYGHLRLAAVVLDRGFHRARQRCPHFLWRPAAAARSDHAPLSRETDRSRARWPDHPRGQCFERARGTCSGADRLRHCQYDSQRVCSRHATESCDRRHRGSAAPAQSARADRACSVTS